MKNKTFELDTELAVQFETFCKFHMHVEQSIVAACIHHFMTKDANERAQVMLSYREWLEVASKSDRGILPALRFKNAESSTPRDADKTVYVTATDRVTRKSKHLTVYGMTPDQVITSLRNALTQPTPTQSSIAAPETKL